MGRYCILLIGFFSIIGISWVSPKGETQQHPLIDQREIGTLGFLIRTWHDQKQILVQAKIEPGNVGIIQLAPTCQATASNSDKVHGGESPLFSDWFASHQSVVLSESLQSEQGTRFFCKQNRNILAQVDGEIQTDDYHKWVGTELIFDLIDNDFLINTDARSVLVTSKWDLLVNRPPFSRHKDAFSAELNKSYVSQKKIIELPQVVKKINQLRRSINKPQIINLDKLHDWFLSQELQKKHKKPFYIRQIKVTAHGREVPEWDQPIIDSSGEGKVVLQCGRYEGNLYFLFKPQIEPGLHDLVELGPSIVCEPGELIDSDDDYNKAGKLLVQTRQSDEGGRFFQDVSEYSIVDIGGIKNPQEGFWLSLNQIQALLCKDSIFTNEARSVLSLILKWL